MENGMIRLEAIEKVYRTDRIETRRAREREPDDRAGRVRLRHGPVGLREEHAPERDRPPRRADARARRAERPDDHVLRGPGPRAPAQRGARLRLPDVPPHPRPSRRRQRRDPAPLPEDVRQGAPPAGARGPRARRPLLARPPLPDPALGRPAAARRDRARDRRRAEGPPRGRADGQPRQRDGRRGHGPPPRAERAREDDRRHGHARSRRRPRRRTARSGSSTAARSTEDAMSLATLKLAVKVLLRRKFFTADQPLRDLRDARRPHGGCGCCSTTSSGRCRPSRGRVGCSTSAGHR